jgi:PTS system mannose-specific IIA component
MTGIVICHRRLAEELLNTAAAILGHHQDLYPFSNDKITAEELYHQIGEFFLKIKNPSRGVILVDLRGGNCWSIGKMIARSHPGFRVLTGVNLPMILSFLTKKNQLTSEELIELLETDAHRGIVLE